MMASNRWKRKARALARLAEDQRGKPEGELARQKLLEIVNNHPEAAQYEPIVELARRDIEWIFKGSHLVEMKRAGVDTDGKWEGANIRDAINAMVSDYKQRYMDRFDTTELIMAGAKMLAGETQEAVA